MQSAEQNPYENDPPDAVFYTGFKGTDAGYYSVFELLDSEGSSNEVGLFRSEEDASRDAKKLFGGASVRARSHSWMRHHIGGY